MRAKLFFVTLVLLIFASHTLASEKKKLIRVGIYDSRAISIAYTYSKYNDNFMQKKSEEKKEAEAKGDSQKVQQLDYQMQQYALKRHKQVFSTTPVNDLLDLVKDKIPEVAKQSGVDLIVSKWQIDYLAPDAERIDITLAMTKLFEPEEGKLENITELMKKEPLSEKEIERLEKEHPD
jgi:hypothetical protein